MAQATRTGHEEITTTDLIAGETVITDAMETTIAPTNIDVATLQFNVKPSSNDPLNNSHLLRPINRKEPALHNDLKLCPDELPIKLMPRWPSLACRPGTPPKIIR
jgi:hypothetical protein